jgi:hypothetical protein
LGANLGTKWEKRQIDTIQIVTLVTGSSVLSALLTSGLSLFVQWRRASANARYLALRVAVTLEAFALACYHVVADHDVHDNSAGNLGKEHDAFPEIAAYPESLEWQALPPRLLSRVLNFRNEIKISEARLKFQWDLDPGGLTETLSEECAHRGSQAMDIVNDLRQTYGLAPLQADYDFAQRLRAKHEMFLEREAIRKS